MYLIPLWPDVSNCCPVLFWKYRKNGSLKQRRTALTMPWLFAPEQLITRREAADRAGVCLMTIDRALADGRLTKYKAKNGNRVRIDIREVDEFVAVTPVSGPALMAS